MWALANVIYVDLRRKGVRRGRIIAFIVGYPGTLISLFGVREGTVSQLTPPSDDEDRLLREIRVDRELREGPRGELRRGTYDEFGREEGDRAPRTLTSPWRLQCSGSLKGVVWR